MYKACDGSFNSTATAVVICTRGVGAIVMLRSNLAYITRVEVYTLNSGTNRTKIFVSNISLKTGYIMIIVGGSCKKLGRNCVERK